MKVNRKMSLKQNHTNETQVDWKVIESYFQNKHLERMVRHQIESYDHFVNNQIKKQLKCLILLLYIQIMIKIKKQDCIH